ncbi:MAG: hypothetical protein NTZ59_06370 [Bacteroidetes bacterium]|jgi:hypothetical protein|nr:hypothetical protein [Bacteroidota bacterium]
MNVKFFFAGVFTLFLLSCDNTSKKLMGKWKVMDVKVTCTNPIQDSLNSIQNGDFVKGNKFTENEQKEIFQSQPEYNFKANDVYEETSNKYTSSGKYKIIDSAIVLSNDLGFVSNVITYKFLDDNKAKFVFQLDMKRHSHIYQYVLAKTN